MTTTATSWRNTRLKYTGRIVAGGTPESGNPDYWGGDVPWLTPVDLGNSDSDAIRGSNRTLTRLGMAAAGLSMLPVGSIVFSTRAPIGSVGLLDCEAVTNQGCKALVPESRVLHSRFGYYLALDSAEELRSRGLGTTFLELAAHGLKNLDVSIPPVRRQAFIAGHLDTETGKIDRLIALRRQQMELLREQRAALIQQAVTRGLDQRVAIKDSGLPWLGQVPAHWQVKRLKYACPHVTVGIVVNPSHHYVDAGIPCLRSLNVRPGELTSDDLVFINDDSHRLLGKSAVFEGDIVAVRTGQPGTAAVVDHRYDNANCIDLIIIRRSPCFDSEYMQLLLNSRFASAQFEADSDGAIQQHFNIGTAKNLQILLPPLTEQVAIRTYVERSSSRIKQLIDMYERQCTLLTEYRGALIHECVTGQRAVPES